MKYPLVEGTLPSFRSFPSRPRAGHACECSMMGPLPGPPLASLVLSWPSAAGNRDVCNEGRIVANASAPGLVAWLTRSQLGMNETKAVPSRPPQHTCPDVPRLGFTVNEIGDETFQTGFTK
jgi:hypothetical protein